MRKSRSHTWRTRMFAALAMLGLVLATVAGGLRVPTPPAGAQAPSGESLLQQLAERLLGLPYPSPNAASVQLLPGALPSDLPLTIPLPPGSTLIGSDERASFGLVTPTIGGPGGFQSSPPPSNGVHVEIVLDAPGSPDDVTAFYKSAMGNLGWPASASQLYLSPVTSSSPALPTTFCQSSRGPYLSVSARATDSGPVDVRLTFDSGFAGQCSAPAGIGPTFVSPPGYGVLPALKAPPGVTVNSSGSSGGGARFGTDATAATDMSAADLRSFYANQLTAAGWTQIDSGGSGMLAWSTWSIPDHSDLQGFLYVRNGPASGQRSLHVEAGSTDPNAATPNSSYSYGPAYYGGYGGSVGSVALTPLGLLSPTPRATATPVPGLGR